MIDGAALAATAKHTPELLDPDDVRRAGRTLETFADLLAGLESFRRDDDTYVGEAYVLTFRVSALLRDTIMFHAFGGES